MIIGSFESRLCEVGYVREEIVVGHVGPTLERESMGARREYPDLNEKVSSTNDGSFSRF